ncbi:MAG: FadR family transcriptional regulator [Pseudolabrys sp.]|nr:FadR family transcriptional regulator [Pseudolabrys sp.]
MSAKRAQKNLALLQPIEAPRGLTAQLVTRLTGDIVSGKLPPGSRLPTEQEMIAATGVSRTVIREAVAALRADGLVVTRQGVGAFVADNVRRPFRVDFDESSSLAEVLNVMELRAGVEIESAGLAAERATADQARKIGERLAAVQTAINRGETAVNEDFVFHCEIADATGNPQFRRFLEYLGRFIIPRQTVWGQTAPVLGKSHLALFQREHEQIFAAIRTHNVKQARTAMQHHLQRSRQRYQQLAVKIGLK